MLSHSKRKITVVAIALLILVLNLAILLPRTAVTPQESDGIEYSYAAINKFVLHQPGYPLYSQISRALVAYWPANPYHILALFSAVTQSLAAVLLFLTLISFGQSVPIAIALTCSWSLHESSLRIGTDAEVFGLHHLLLGLMLLGCAGITKFTTLRYSYYLLGLLFGLAASHHQTTVLWIPLLLSLICLAPKAMARLKNQTIHLLQFTLGCALGLCCYLLLLGDNNGMYQAPNSISDLIGFVLRQDYGTFSFKSGTGSFEANYLPHFFEVVFTTRPLLILAIPCSLLLLIRKRDPVLIGLVLTGALHMLFLSQLRYLAPPEVFGEWIERFYPLIMLYLTILLSYITRLSNRNSFILSLLVLMLFSYTPSALTAADARHDRVVEFELNQIARELPMRSIFFSNEDRHILGLQYHKALVPKSIKPKVYVATTDMSKSFQDKLMLLFPELKNKETSTLAAFALHCVDNGIRMFSTAENQVPSHLIGINRGTIVEWVKPGAVQVRDDVDARAIALCHALSEPLVVARQRRLSRWIVGSRFIAPFKAFVGETKSPEVQENLSAALGHFLAGNLSGANAKCRIAEEIINQSSIE